MDLEVLQFQHRAWLAHNFPDQTLEQSFMGVVEEVGELAHVFLKSQQKIRGYESRDIMLEEAADCIGDIVIFLDGVCDQLGLDFPSVVSETWRTVRRRDWQTFPKNGLTE